MASRIMASRMLKNDHVRVGWTAGTENTKKANWKAITILSSYQTEGLGKERLVSVSVLSGGMTTGQTLGKAVLHLTSTGAVELAKGLLMNVLQASPITMAADEEFRSIIDQCKAAIDREDDDARQVVECLRREPNATV